MLANSRLARAGVCAASVLAIGSVDGASASSFPTAQQQLSFEESIEFFVCDSQIDGMNGKYVLHNRNDNDGFRSDQHTPVFVREDDDEGGESGGNAFSVSTTSGRHQEQDFRLFRHNGFWMFADVGPWPPQTHFRCDPTKRERIPDLDLYQVCGVNLQTPPRMGYSPANPDHKVSHLVLQRQECRSTSGSMDNAETQDANLSKPATASATTITSRSSEL